MFHRLALAAVFPCLILARDWTVMVYMAADNDLSAWADSDLVEMCAVGSSEPVAAIVQIDQPAIGGRRLEMRKPQARLLTALGIIDMCSWQTLADFIAWTIQEYPAKRYLTVLWDHGTGWTAGGQRSFGSDYSSGNRLSIAGGDLRKALDYAHAATGEIIDLLAFDACLMQQIEVAVETETFVKTIAAAQTNWPLAGFPYDRVLDWLEKNSGADERTAAAAIVEICRQHYAQIQPAAISAVDVGALSALTERGRKVFSHLAAAGAAGPGIRNARRTVQTIPTLGHVPSPDDEFVDFGDFLLRADRAELADLQEAYAQAVLICRSWGDVYGGATGLGIFFPYHYTQFKGLLPYYQGLDWCASKWLSFLNWYYADDDIRPTTPVITSSAAVQNRFRLTWSGSVDLAPVDYTVFEAADTAAVFADGSEDTAQWTLAGFTLDSSFAHSGRSSFFSGNASNLRNSMTTRSPVSLDAPGLLELYLRYVTEDRRDSLIVDFGPSRASFYGNSNGWTCTRLLLPPGSHRLTVSYHSDGSNDYTGGYVDDVTVYELRNGRSIRTGLTDTALAVFNKLKGSYLYAILPRDRYGNEGSVSNFTGVTIDDFALPYSLPSPFQESCRIVLDYPDALQPRVKIFSVSGRLVRTFARSEIVDKTVAWDGRDAANIPVAAGLYFVVLQDGNFKKIGKIARQR